jgi:ketosteroid isomerase-like protein
MSVERTRKVIDEYLTDLLKGGDFARHFAEDVVWTTTETGDRVTGRQAVRDFIQAFHTQAFSARPEVRNVHVGEDFAVLEADFVGTHSGSFAGIEPTGASVRMPYCVVYDVAGDEITAVRAYLPVAAIIAKLRNASAS